MAFLVRPASIIGSVGTLASRGIQQNLLMSRALAYTTFSLSSSSKSLWGPRNTALPHLYNYQAINNSFKFQRQSVCGGLYAAQNYSTEVNSSDSQKGDLVYHGRVGSMFKMLKLFSLTTSTIGLALQPYLVISYQDAPLVTAVPFFAALNIFVFVNPFLIHYIGKKYVLEMYYNGQTKVFTAVLLSFFARKYSFTFTADDVSVPDVPGLFSLLTVKGRPLFVVGSDFFDIEIYKHMMGFDKPLDLTYLSETKKKK